MKFWKKVKRHSSTPTLAEGRRPSIEDPRVFAAMINRIISGEAIYQILADPKMPSRMAFYSELMKGTERGKTIARAREAGQHAEVDETIRIADSANYLNHNAVKVKVMARQWRASKLNSTMYGDLARLSVKSEETGVLKVTLVNDPDAG